MTPVTIPLSEPIPDADLKQITSVTLNPPRGRHLMQAGSVMNYAPDAAGNMRIQVDPAAMGKLMGICCALPNSSIETLAAPDFMEISGVLMGFLAPSGLSTATSTSPGSGAT